MNRISQRSIVFVSLALVSVILSSCTKSADDGSDGKYRSTKELSDSLLLVTDMPDGWEETQRQVFDKRENENPSIDPSVWCKQGSSSAAPLVSLAGESGADVEMSRPHGGGSGASMLRLQAWSNADVQEYFATAREAVTECDGVTTTDENGAVSTTAMITGKSVGDESVSFSQQLSPPVGTKGEKFGSIGRTTIARFGKVIMVIQIGDAAPEGSLALMDESTWWDIVNRAATKLKR